MPPHYKKLQLISFQTTPLLFQPVFNKQHGNLKTQQREDNMITIYGRFVIQFSFLTREKIVQRKIKYKVELIWLLKIW